MQNFLTETVETLQQNNFSSQDVRWVGITSGSNGQSWCSWEEFAQIANFEYNPQQSAGAVNPLLVVVGDNWWLKRSQDAQGAWSWTFLIRPIQSTYHHNPEIKMTNGKQ